MEGEGGADGGLLLGVEGVGGGEGQEDLPAALADVGAQPGQAHRGPPGHPAQLPGVQGQVGGDNRHAGALVRPLVLGQALSQDSANVLSVNGEVGQLAVVGEHQDAHGVGDAVDGEQAGGRPDAALEPVAHHAHASAHGTLLKGVGGVLQGGIDLVLAHRPVADVVEPAVVALQHHSVHRGGVQADGLPPPAQVLHQGVLHLAHVEGVGEGHRPLQGAQLLHLDQAGALAEAVEHVGRGGDEVVEGVFGAGDHHGDPGFMSGRIHGAVPHGHTGYVGNLIPGAPGQAAHLDAVVCGALMQGRFLPYE